MNAVRFVARLALLFVLLALCAESTPAAAPPGRDPGDSLPRGALLRLGSARLRHPARITSLILSDDGETLATADQLGNVRVWHVSTGRLLLSLPRRTIWIALSADGQTLATAERDQKGDQLARTWSVRTGKEIQKFAELSAQAVAFSQDGKYLAGSDEKGRIVVCETATAKVTKRLGKIRPVLRTRIAFSRDGDLLACVDRAFGARQNYTVAVWDLKDEAERIRLADERDDMVTSLTFSPDGDWVVTATSDHTQIHMARSGKHMETVRGATHGAMLDRTGALLVSGGTLAVWNTKGDATVRVVNFNAPATLAAISLDARLVVSASAEENRIRVWDVKTGRERRMATDQHRDEIRGVAWSHDGTRIATASADGTARIWNTRTGLSSHPLEIKRAGTAEVASMLSFSRDGRTLTTPGERWRLGDERLDARLPFGHPMARSHDGRRFAIVGKRNEVQIQDENGRVLDRLMPVRDQLDPEFAALAFSHDRRLMALGHADEVKPGNKGKADSIQLWDVTTGRYLRGLRLSDRAPSVLQFSPDGTVLLCWARGESPQLFDVARGRELFTLADHDVEGQKSRPFAFSPDGALLASNGKGDRIVIWETASGQVVRELPGHDGGTRSLSFSPDGRRLLSGGADTTAIVWSIAPEDGESVKRGKWDKQTAARLWKDLSLTPHFSYPALWSLLAAPDAAVAALKERLLPDPHVDRERIKRLIADLSDDDFTTRKTADEQLERLGKQAADPLRRAAKTVKDPEARKRIAGLLKKLDAPPGAAEWRDRRAIRALEMLGTPAAEAILESLARGGASGRRTIAAEAALLRLDAARRDERPSDDPHRSPGEVVRGRPRRLGAHKGEVYAIAFAPDGKTAFTAGRDGLVRHWDLGTQKEVGFVNAHEGGVFALSLSGDGKRLATAGADGKVRLWDVAGFRRLLTVDGHKGGSYAVALSPDGSLIFSGGKDGLMRQWSTQNGKEGKAIFVTLGTVRSIRFSSDGARVIVGATGGWGQSYNGRVVPLHFPDEVRVWAVKTSKQQPDRIAQRGHDAALLRDGRLALTTEFVTDLDSDRNDETPVVYDASVRLVEADTGKLRLELFGRGAAALSPDGRYALTAKGSNFGAGGEASPSKPLVKQTQLWETATGDEVLRVPGEAAVVALSPDGRRALLGRRDGELWIADLAPTQLERTKPGRQAFAVLWAELGGDGASAYRASWALVEWGRAAVPLIRERLEPAPATDPALRRLIVGLNAERYVVRRSSYVALAERGAEAVAALKAASTKATGPLLRRQIGELIELPGAAKLPNDRRLERADWVLERIGTAEAAELRKYLAARR